MAFEFTPFKVPSSPNLPNLNSTQFQNIFDENTAPKDDKMPFFEEDNCPPAKKQQRRKKKNLTIKARRLINCVTHYHVTQEGVDRWIPIFDVENFNDVVEFEKYVAKVDIDSEEDLSCWDGPPDEVDEDETNLKESIEGIEEKSSQNEDDFNLKIDETEKKQIENEAECSKVPALENKIVEEEAELTPLCEKSFPQNVRENHSIDTTSANILREAILKKFQGTEKTQLKNTLLSPEAKKAVLAAFEKHKISASSTNNENQSSSINGGESGGHNSPGETRSPSKTSPEFCTKKPTKENTENEEEINNENKKKIKRSSVLKTANSDIACDSDGTNSSSFGESSLSVENAQAIENEEQKAINEDDNSKAVNGEELSEKEPIEMSMMEGILTAVIKEDSAVFFLDHFRENKICSPLPIKECEEEKEEHSKKESAFVPFQSDLSSLFSSNTDIKCSAENIVDQIRIPEVEKEHRELKSKRAVKVFDYAAISDPAENWPVKIFDYSAKQSESTKSSDAQESCAKKTETEKTVEKEPISEETKLKTSTSLMPKRRRKSDKKEKIKSSEKSTESVDGEEETSHKSPMKKTAPTCERIDTRSKTVLLHNSPEKYSTETDKWALPVLSPDKPRGWERIDSRNCQKSTPKNNFICERIDSRPKRDELSTNSGSYVEAPARSGNSREKEAHYESPSKYSRGSWIIPRRSPDRPREWGKSDNKRGEARRTDVGFKRDEGENRRQRRLENENRNFHSNRNWRDETVSYTKIKDERDSKRSSRRSRDRIERTKEQSKEYSIYEERAKNEDEKMKHPRDIDTRTRNYEPFSSLAERLRLKKENRKAHEAALLQQKNENDKKLQSKIEENLHPKEKESDKEKTPESLNEKNPESIKEKTPESIKTKVDENVAENPENPVKTVLDEPESKKENLVITAFGNRIIESDKKLIRRKVESKKEKNAKDDDIDPFKIFEDRKLDDILKRTKNKNSCQKTQKPAVKTISKVSENGLGVRKGILKRTKSYQNTVKSTEEETSKMISTQDDSSETKILIKSVSKSPEKKEEVSNDESSFKNSSSEESKNLPKKSEKQSENQNDNLEEKEKRHEIMEGSFEDSMPALDELDFVDKNEDTSDYRDNKKIKEAFQEVPNLDKLRYDEVSTMKKNEVLPEKMEKLTSEDDFLSQEDKQSSLLNNEYLNTDICSFEDLLQPLPPISDNSENFSCLESTSKSPQKTDSSIEKNDQITRSKFPKLSVDENRAAPPSPISFSFGSVLVSSPKNQQSDNSSSENESSVVENIVESETNAQMQKTTVEEDELNSKDEEESQKKNDREESSLKKEDSFLRTSKSQKVEARKTSNNRLRENEFAATWKAQNPKISQRNSKKNTPKKKPEKLKVPRKRRKLSAEAEEVYEVEKILRKRSKKGIEEYEVKWVGYGQSHNTWEIIENLDNCPELMKEFEKQESKKRACKNSESTAAALKLPQKKK